MIHTLQAQHHAIEEINLKLEHAIIHDIVLKGKSIITFIN